MAVFGLLSTELFFLENNLNYDLGGEEEISVEKLPSETEGTAPGYGAVLGRPVWGPSWRGLC